MDFPDLILQNWRFTMTPTVCSVCCLKNELLWWKKPFFQPTPFCFFFFLSQKNKISHYNIGSNESGWNVEKRHPILWNVKHFIRPRYSYDTYAWLFSYLFFLSFVDFFHHCKWYNFIATVIYGSLRINMKECNEFW